MKLWHVSQDENADYDTFDSMVVAAETEEAARLIHPRSSWTPEGTTLVPVPGGQPWQWQSADFHTWASSPDKVTVAFIGEAAEGVVEGVILASFNAG